MGDLLRFPNSVSALTYCRTLTRYQSFHIAIRLRLPNYNFNQITVSQKFVLFTMSVPNKTNSAIGPTNQNHRDQHVYA